jgi:hypothetical protein
MADVSLGNLESVVAMRLAERHGGLNAVAAAAVEVAENPDKSRGRVFVVSGTGLKPVSRGHN